MRAKVVATATLVSNGLQALAPAAALAPNGRFWIRNGLGEVSAVKIATQRTSHGLALLDLVQKVPAGELARTQAIASPGSVGFAVEFLAQADAQPAWPMLKSGFIGTAQREIGMRRLGIELGRAGARGGPVFNAGGLLAGVAVASTGLDLLATTPVLEHAFGRRLFAEPPATAPVHQGLDAIYETALAVTLQLIRA